jgi:enterochelin esterase-like enzyme
VAVAALAALALVASSPGTLSEGSYRSRALGGTLPFAVYLPPGYATSNARYPVIYFLHGLPASPDAYRGIGFVATALDRLRRPAIVVAPRGARADDGDPEYLNWGPGRNWATAIARELPRYVDAHYSTIRSRRGRALVGLSAGGYGAVVLALSHLSAFSVVESWSGYFRPTNPSGTKVIPHIPTQSGHSLVPELRADERRRPTFFAFYVGAEDRRFRAENEQLDRELRAARVPHVFRIYPGAHEQPVWQAHAGQWLGVALDHLSAPR